MSAQGSPVVLVQCAERGSGARPTEDRIFTTDNAVIVLDGATQPDAPGHNGGWLAGQLGEVMASRLSTEPGVDLRAMLEDSIRAVARRFDLRPGSSPSTTVAVVRWSTEAVDALVLCDSTVVALHRGGQVDEVRDDRLAVASEGLQRPAGDVTEDGAGWQRLVDAQRRVRNTAGGYWVAEAVPEAAHHAVTRRWQTSDLAVVLALTDGVSVGVDHYGVPSDWAAAIELAARDPRALVNVVHAAEASDSERRRWPRSKRHDDKALAVLRFDLATAQRP